MPTVQTDYRTLFIGLLAAFNATIVAFHVYSFSLDQLNALNGLITYGVIAWAIWKNHHTVAIPAPAPTPVHVESVLDQPVNPNV